MPFLGKNPTAGFSTIVKDDLTPDGSTTAFTLSKNVASANDIAVFVGNVRQEPTDAYSVSGTTLTMTAAPASGINFYVLHIAGTLESSVVPAAGTTVPGAFGVSGDLTVDTRVGIGTATPSVDLDLQTTGSGTKVNIQTSGNALNVDLIDASATSRIRHVGTILDIGADLNNLGTSDPRVRFRVGNTAQASITGHGGIAFGSDTAAANTLDDYEEGTFTPTIYGTSGGTPVNGSGFYTKIGNTVKTTIQFQNVNMSTGGHTGTLRIGGLPFASANQLEVAAVPMTYNVAITGTDKYNIGLISDNSTTITYYRIRDLSSWTGTPVPTGSTVYLYSTFIYTTNA